MSLSAPAHLCTTFQNLHDAGACVEGYGKLANHIRDQFAVTPKDYGMHRPIPINVVLESNGWGDTIWVLRNAMNEDTEDKARLRFLRRMACDFAEHVLPIFEKARLDDKRPHETIRVARLFAEGKATATELAEARKGCCQARRDAAAAAAAADAAADAAYAAADAAAYAAADAAYAARLTEKQWQRERFAAAMAEESSLCATSFSEGSAEGYEEASAA